MYLLTAAQRFFPKEYNVSGKWLLKNPLFYRPLIIRCTHHQLKQRGAESSESVPTQMFLKKSTFKRGPPSLALQCSKPCVSAESLRLKTESLIKDLAIFFFKTGRDKGKRKLTIQSSSLQRHLIPDNKNSKAIICNFYDDRKKV